MRVRSNSRHGERSKRSGFTLIEILIVIGIVMVLSALLMSGFSNSGANSRRQSCQSNLAQLYQSCRLYQQDEGGFPFYDPSGYSEVPTSVGLQPNIGLWALYAFPLSDDPNTAANETNVNMVDKASASGRYLRSAKVLHCPQDIAPANYNLFNSAGNYNDGYLSYQQIDNEISPVAPSYQSIRSISRGTTTDSKTLWKRQLVPFEGTAPFSRQPADDTIVTWCRFHRKAVGGRDFDNVLFYDGSVQLLLRETNGAVGWKRTPKAPT